MEKETKETIKGEKKMKSEQVEAFFENCVWLLVLLFFDTMSGNCKEMNKAAKKEMENEVRMVISQFIHYLTHIEAKNEFVVETPVLITKNLLRAGTNAGMLYNHLDTEFYRNRIRKVA